MSQYSSKKLNVDSTGSVILAVELVPAAWRGVLCLPQNVHGHADVTFVQGRVGEYFLISVTKTPVARFYCQEMLCIHICIFISK